MITTRAMRRFAQSAVAVLIATYLGLPGFLLVQVGTMRQQCLATAYCQHLGAPYGLKVPGTSAGTQPDAAASLQIAYQ